MTIEIIKGQDNAVADFFSASTQTPETDACWDKYLRYPYSDIGTGDIRILAQRLERERDEAIRLLIEVSEYSTTTSQESTEKFLRKIGKWEEAK
jgi:hypothetical protein